jgi:hypothetical protein
LRASAILFLDLFRTVIAEAKDNKVIAIRCKTVGFEKLIEHWLHDRVINFPFIATLSADEMMMVMCFCSLVVGFSIPCIGGYD